MTPTDIICLVWQRGWSLNQLAKEAGVSRQNLSAALRQPCISGEMAILKFLREPGHKLWPDRYAPDGRRLVRRGSSARRGQAAKRGARA